MNKLLTQEEINALLANVTERGGKGKVESASPGGVRRRPVQIYDFKHPERIAKEQLRTLRTIHDNLARMLATYMSTTMRTLIDVNFSAIDQVTYNEYTLSMSVPTALGIVNLKNLEGKAIIEISPQFLLFAVDRLLGGIGDTRVESRELTQMEQNVVRKLFQTIVEYFNEVWDQVHPLGAEYESFESDPQFVQIARSSEVLAVVYFEIQVRGAVFPMSISIPYYVLEPILQKLSSQSILAITGRRIPSEERGNLIVERIKASRLELVVRLAETAWTVRDFLELEVDDVIQINQRTTQPLLISLGGKIKMIGAPGKIGRRRAVRVLRPVTPTEELMYE